MIEGTGTKNTELNDLRKIILAKKISVERVSVYIIVENLVEHG